jgi:hypothetical protein
LSPQSRRGRAAPVSHRKSPARGAATASRKPAAAVDESDDELADGVDPKAATLAPVRRRRGMARLRKNPAYKYASEAFGAYLPLFLLFLVVLGGFWTWTTFGPHTPTPKENWQRIETKWLQPREDARQNVTDAMSDFKLQQAGYTEFRDKTKGWMVDLTAVGASGWDGPKPSIDVVGGQFAFNSELVQQFIDAGNAEVALLDQVVAAKTPDEVLAIGADIINAEKTFVTTYANAYTQVVGSFPKASEEPLALPSGNICPSPSAPASASPSPSPSASPSPSTSASPLAGTSLSPSPSIVVSPSPSASIDPCAVASPSPAAT